MSSEEGRDNRIGRIYGIRSTSLIKMFGGGFNKYRYAHFLPLSYHVNPANPVILSILHPPPTSVTTSTRSPALSRVSRCTARGTTSEFTSTATCGCVTPNSPSKLAIVLPSGSSRVCPLTSMFIHELVRV